MKTNILLLLCALLTGLGTALPINAQSTGGIAGIVRDAATGEALPGVNLALEDIGRGAVSGADGRFEITGVPAGTHGLRASFIGYETARQSVVVQAGIATRLGLALTPAATGLGEVVVEGRSANLVGVAGSASEGAVGQAQLAARPLLRVGEVLETVPGTIVTQHSGSGKANQFFLRGFNLDHGTDFAASVEGRADQPADARARAGLPRPELPDPRADRGGRFREGAAGRGGGNFATAGRAQVRLVRRLDAGIAKAEAGTDGYYGGLVAQSSPLGGGDLLYGLKARYYDGRGSTPRTAPSSAAS